MRSRRAAGQGLGFLADDAAERAVGAELLSRNGLPALEKEAELAAISG